jgi:DNA (cytosine-5)-methyltransferase 1
MARHGMSRRREILVADLFCGAGGFSTGCERALRRLNLKMKLVCVNHWPVAIETHTRNHPNALHYCQDLAMVPPHVAVPQGFLDILMAAPSCTHHSGARGGKPTSDQQRADPWHIIAWLTQLDVDRLLIENVWEIVKWGPVDPASRRPIKSREGEYFKLFIKTLRGLDYDPEWRRLNAADFSDPTTRRRFILMAKKRRRAPRPITWALPSHGKDTPRPWRPARDIIDWGIRGRSIFGRPVPLAPKTLARILAGVIKFGWPQIFVTLLLRELERSLLYSIRSSFAGRHAPRAEMKRRCRLRARAYIKWLKRMRLEPAAAIDPAGKCEPIVVTLRNHADGRSLALPVPALAANGMHIGLAEPIIINGRRNNKAKPASAAPVPTLDTKGGVWLAEPFIATVAHGNSERENSPDERRCRSLEQPLQTIHGGGNKFAIVEPFVLSQASGGAPRAASEPLPTACAGGAIAMISAYYGSGSGETCTTIEQPLPTATAKARFGLVVPITHSDLSNRARDVEIDPLPPLTTAHRGELALISGEDAPQVDILFRMLQPHELAAAMGFIGGKDSYIFAGNKTEQVKQIGNAIPVGLAEACVMAIMDDHPAVMAAKAVPKPRRARPTDAAGAAA